MIWIVDKKGTEIVFSDKPSKGFMFWYNQESPNNRIVSLPKSYTKRSINRDLTWEDEPVELKED